MTAGWPPPGGVWGRCRASYPAWIIPSSPPAPTPQPRPASPQSVPMNASVLLLSTARHAMSGFPVHQAVTNKKENQTSGTPRQKGNQNSSENTPSPKDQIPGAAEEVEEKTALNTTIIAGSSKAPSPH